MFNPDIVEKIARANERPFRSLRSMENTLQRRFWGMNDPILALLLSVACNEPLLLIGKPGTAKSRLIRAFCETVGLIGEEDIVKNGPLADHLIQVELCRKDLDQAEKGRIKEAAGYFEYLLTPFTEPNELFGFYNIERLIKPGSSSSGANGKLERIEKGMMQISFVVYLDEIFNASSAILNSLLAFLNERIFHDRGERKRVLYKALFAATNRVPESGELAAVYDRFLLRCRIDNVKADPPTVKSLLEKSWTETYAQPSPKNIDDFKTLFQELDQLHNALSASSRNDLTPNPAYDRQREQNFYSQLITKINIARTGGFSEMSNRRVVKMLHVMLIHCMYRSINDSTIKPLFELGDPELELMPKFFYDRVYEPLAWK